jgi:L-cysteine desulfidase
LHKLSKMIKTDMKPEITMKNMGMIASPGMIKTEKIIVEIMESKFK